MNREELTLGMIDNQAHLSTSREVVAAVAFAVRAGHSDLTARRFVTAAVMTDSLSPRAWWADLLRIVAELERKEAEATAVETGLRVGVCSPGCPVIRHRH